MPMKKKQTTAYYDDPKYDYQKYWETREYENRSEQIILKKILKLIDKKDSLIDIGCGFGRLTSTYTPLFKRCLLVEPSEKLLNQAKEFYQKYPHLTFKKAFVEHLPTENESFDVALLVRIIHHLTNLPEVMAEIKRVLKPGGYLILEYANKMHFKNYLEAILKFNFKFFTDHQPESLIKKSHVAPFFNYHPNQIKTILFANGFKVIRRFSASNFRFPLLKKMVPLKVLLFLERIISPLASRYRFGPSIFVLSKKK